MDESSSSDDIQFFIDQISEKYMVQIKNDRQQSEQKQMQDMKHLLQEWADKITNTTKEIVGSIQSANKESPLDGIVDDIKDRQSKMIAVRLFVASALVYHHLYRPFKVHTINRWKY